MDIIKRKVYKHYLSKDYDIYKEDKEIKCPKCESVTLYSSLQSNKMVCPQCGHYFRMSADQYIDLLTDKSSFNHLFQDKEHFRDPLKFPSYADKVHNDEEKFGINEAIKAGNAMIHNHKINIGVFDSHFRMGSMGENVGDIICSLADNSANEKIPLILVVASGGARLQEGLFSLYQMVNTVEAINKLKRLGVLNIIVMTDPTTGGVLASFVSEADYLISEPHAQIGFAGKRVVKGTLNKTDDDVQNAEANLKYGHIDNIVSRYNLKNYLAKLIDLHETPAQESHGYAKTQLKSVKSTKPEDFMEILSKVRDPNRSSSMDYIQHIFDGLIELHGDRIEYDDHSVFTGIGSLHKIPFTIIAQLHSTDINQNIDENFGMTRPSGYRKIVRSVKLSERYKRPIVVFVDTKGADPLSKSEKQNQAKAIADSIAAFSSAKTPIIAFLIGEGGSGGAIAISVADKINMLSDSMFSVISPEGAASILWHDKTKKLQAMESLKMTPQALYRFGLVDNVIESTNLEQTCQIITTTIENQLKSIKEDKNFQRNRLSKYRRMGI